MKAILAVLLLALVACQETEPQLEFSPIPFIKCMLADGKLIPNIKAAIDAIKEKDFVKLIVLVPELINEVTKCWNTEEVNLELSVQGIIDKIKEYWNKIPPEFREQLIDTLINVGKTAAKKVCVSFTSSKYPEFSFICDLFN